MRISLRTVIAALLAAIVLLAHGGASQDILDDIIDEAALTAAPQAKLVVTLPKVFLRDVPATVQLTLPELDRRGRPWPKLVHLSVFRYACVCGVN